jgi:pilus assembly protein CpaB
MNLALNKRTILMVVVALFAAGITALFVRGWLNAERASMGGTPMAYQVLVAKSDMSAGRFLRAQDLRWQGWPKGTLAPTYILQGKRKPEDFEGAVMRHSLVAGQPITEAAIVRPGEQGFLAAVLEPGMRAVSIQVNAITGISGFVIPGDRVDVVLTHTVPSPDRSAPRYVSETVLEDIRVIAVDQRIEDKNAKAAVAKTVTMQVTPKQVEAIGIISRIGRISLSLRPVARVGLEEGSKPKAPLVQTKENDGVIVAVSSANAAETDAVAAPEAPSAPAPKTSARKDRSGITLDSEVSRVLGRKSGGSGTTVNVVRGSKAEEQKF